MTAKSRFDQVGRVSPESARLLRTHAEAILDLVGKARRSGVDDIAVVLVEDPDGKNVAGMSGPREKVLAEVPVIAAVGERAIARTKGQPSPTGVYVFIVNADATYSFAVDVLKFSSPVTILSRGGVG